MGNAAALMAYGMLFGLFFLMPFLLIRAYGESALGAGLRLSLVPVVLSLATPFAGALSDRLGARLLTAGGTTICALALLVPYFVVDGKASNLPLIMVALGVIGLGQGLFTSPNNNSIMASAPERLTSAAGGLMNVTRSVGTSLGLAATATCLSWQLEVVAGSRIGRTAGVAAGGRRQRSSLAGGFRRPRGGAVAVRPMSRSSPRSRPVVDLE